MTTPSELVALANATQLGYYGLQIGSSSWQGLLDYGTLAAAFKLLRDNAEETITDTDPTGVAQLYCYEEDGKMHYEYSVIVAREVQELPK